MSDVFSFRLESKNPREAQAEEVIEAWAKQGYSLRHIVTEALLLLGKHDVNATDLNDITETVDRLSRLVDKLEDHFEIVKLDHPANAELSAAFLSSVKMSVKPGVKINDG
jgi:hypothetical protein